MKVSVDRRALEKVLEGASVHYEQMHYCDFCTGQAKGWNQPFTHDDDCPAIQLLKDLETNHRLTELRARIEQFLKGHSAVHSFHIEYSQCVEYTVFLHPECWMSDIRRSLHNKALQFQEDYDTVVLFGLRKHRVREPESSLLPLITED